jgi:hypothetical protein
VEAGKLLMVTGAFEDALKALKNGDEVQPTPESSFQ